MKSYYGEQKDCEIMENVTLQEFQKRYKELAYGKTTEVIASSILPIMDSAGCSMTREPGVVILYNAVLFFNVREQLNKELNKESGKVEVQLTEKEGQEMDIEFNDPVQVPESKKELDTMEV